jgi:Arc/MetJ family transcription regulator
VSRTNIDLDDDLLLTVMRRYSLRTKTEAVDLALRRLAGQPMSTRQLLAMRGAGLIEELPPDQPPRTGAAVGSGRRRR